MDKVLYFNGCSWARGSELDNVYRVEDDLGNSEIIVEDRTSRLLSKKLGYKEINKSQDGKGNQDIIEETINFAYGNEHNKDNIIINVWLTSPERIWMYYNDKQFQLNVHMILADINPHQTKEDDWEEMKDDVKVFTEMWAENYHNQKYYITQYVKDILLLYNTLKTLGYKFLISNAFYNLDTEPEFNLPFYENSPTKHFSKLNDDGLWKNVVSKLPKENFLFGSVEHSIKDKLIDLWDTTKDDYSDYDVSKLTSILKEKEGCRKKPSYFFYRAIRLW